MEAIVYWEPDTDPGTVILTAALPLANIPATTLPKVDPRATRTDPNGTSLILRSGKSTLRLLLLDEALHDAPLAALVPLDTTGLDRIEALARFWKILNDRQPISDMRLTQQRRRRLRQMLQAVDGHLDGATYRQIANAIYGTSRVAAHPWKTSTLRDSTIGLVKDGRTLINGGYRRLLQHRRRQ